MAAGPGRLQIPGPGGRPEAQSAGAGAADVWSCTAPCSLLIRICTSKPAVVVACHAFGPGNDTHVCIQLVRSLHLDRFWWQASRSTRGLNIYNLHFVRGTASAALQLICVAGECSNYVCDSVTAGPAAAGGCHAAVWRPVGQLGTALPGAHLTHWLLNSVPL